MAAPKEPKVQTELPALKAVHYITFLFFLFNG